MALSHLSLDSDKYQIFFDNTSQENSLSDNELSTAGSFTTTLDTTIDLSTLLYLKSTTAELSVSQFTIDSLPLTFSELEYIKVTVNLPEDIATCNQYYNSPSLKEFNQTPYIIHLEDYSTPDPEAAISHLNEKLEVAVTDFLIKSSLKIVFDTDIFIKESTHQLSLKDIKLIIKYLDIALFSRHIIHSYITTQAKILDDDISSLITFQSKDTLTAITENQIISESKTLQNLNLRPKPTENNNVNLEIFYNINLRNAYTQNDGPKQVIQSETNNWMSTLEMIEYTDPSDENSPLTDDSANLISTILEANKALIKLALKTRQILTLYRDRLDRKGKGQTSRLFHDSLISLCPDASGTKLRCELNPKLFLCENKSFVLIEFPYHTSYILGCPNGATLTIGPITNNPNIDVTKKPKLTNQITENYQRPFSNIRCMPRILYLASDLIASLRRDFWLKNTAYESCHLVHCYIMDESTINSRLICKTNENEIFYKISNLKCLLSRFSFHVLDENFRQCLFPQKTYNRIGLTIKPAISEN